MKAKTIKTQSLISGLFGFLLTTIFVVLYVCIGLGIGVFNNRSIMTSLNSTNYFSKAYDELNSKTEALLSDVGLPTTLFEKVINLDRVYVGGNNYIKATLQGVTPQLNLDKLRLDMRDCIEEYLWEEEILPTEDLDRGIEDVITYVEKEYSQVVELKFVDYFMDYKADYNRLMIILIPILLLLAGVLCFYLVRMHHYIHRGVRYITYAVLASSGLTLLTTMYLLLTRSYGKLNLQPKYYYDFLVSFLRRDIMVFAYIGVIGFILSVVLISFIGFLKNRINNG